MAFVYGVSVLFYLVKQVLEFTNSGLVTDAGTIRLNGTDIAVADMSSASAMETAINAELGAGTVTVTLASETFTFTFQNGQYYDMKVLIGTTAQVVSDVTTPGVSDLLIAEQTDIKVSRKVKLADKTNKGSNGNEESVPITKVLEAMNENIFVDDDANYQMLRDAISSGKYIFAYVKLASANLKCRAVLSDLEEKAPVDDIVRCTVNWKSSGGYERVT